MFDHITQVDDAGNLFISGVIHDWLPVHDLDIAVVVDLEDDIDHGVPTAADEFLYVYLPIHDGDMPHLDRMHAVANLCADLIRRGQRVLVHCGLGLNRSALLCGLVMVELGMPADEAITQIREKRPGALFNKTFAKYLADATPDQTM